MRRIHVRVDEGLLEELAREPEVQQDGRSAVIRRALADYLRRKREDRIAALYRQAYAGGAGFSEDFAGWEGEAVWPT